MSRRDGGAVSALGRAACRRPRAEEDILEGGRERRKTKPHRENALGRRVFPAARCFHQASRCGRLLSPKGASLRGPCGTASRRLPALCGGEGCAGGLFAHASAAVQHIGKRETPAAPGRICGRPPSQGRAKSGWRRAGFGLRWEPSVAPILRQTDGGRGLRNAPSIQERVPADAARIPAPASHASSACARLYSSIPAAAGPWDSGFSARRPPLCRSR